MRVYIRESKVRSQLDAMRWDGDGDGSRTNNSNSTPRNQTQVRSREHLSYLACLGPKKRFKNENQEREPRKRPRKSRLSVYIIRLRQC